MTLWWLLPLPALVLAVYLAVLLRLYLVQRRLLYPADPTPPALLPLAGRLPEEVETRGDDGLAVRHWYWPASKPEGVEILLLHGNAGHRGDRAEKYAPLAALGHGLLLAGYRGYGGNPGTPSEAGLIADARGAARWLEQRGGGRPLVLYGESLGAAVAVALAAEGIGDALVLECPFDSAVTLARQLYPWLPIRLLMKDHWDSAARIGRVCQPLLWLHGGLDAVTPLALGRRLYEIAPGPKQSLVVPEGGHCDFLERPEVQAAVARFLAGRTPTQA